MKKFGTENTEIMDLLHGGGICYRTAIPTAKDYHDDCGRHGIGSGVEKKLAKNIKKWQDAGYTFTCKVFPNIGHGGLAAEHPEQFLEEAIAAHENSLEKAGHA
ncbi:MAG: hypothetical protein Q4F83_01115 [Eubacteriales bacterium]|nr:hypothetical protein [Eubacteriales bacterium]